MKLNDRAMRLVFSAVSQFPDRRASIEQIAELAYFSPGHTNRIVRKLAQLEIIRREDGQRGRAYCYAINDEVAQEYGL